jgi:hypothetical protein
MAVPFFFHWYVSPVPVAVTLKVGVSLVNTVASVGCALIVGAVGVGEGAGVGVGAGVGAGVGDEDGDEPPPPQPANSACTTAQAAAF